MCRGLLKKRQSKGIKPIWVTEAAHIRLQTLLVDKILNLGEKLSASFTLNNLQTQGKCRLEFVINLMKKRANKPINI